MLVFCALIFAALIAVMIFLNRARPIPERVYCPIDFYDNSIT